VADTMITLPMFDDDELAESNKIVIPNFEDEEMPPAEPEEDLGPISFPL